MADTGPVAGERRLSPQGRRLLDAATVLFAKRGAVATSVRDITHACGLTPGSLYNHFSSKEELLHVLVRGIHLAHEQALLEGQAQVAGDPVAELTVMVQVVVHRHASRPQRARVANREFPLLTGAMLDDVLAVRRRLLHHLADVLRRGQEEGVLDLDRPLTPGLLATAVFDMSVHLTEWFVEGSPFTSVGIARRYAVLACRMAGTRADERVLDVGERWVSRPQA